MVQQLMVMKQASRSISRVESQRGLLAGEMISTSDLDFVIDEVSSLNVQLHLCSADEIVIEHGSHR